MIAFEVNSESFIEYLRTVEKGFYRMVETMKNVARIIELETVPYVPLDTSALEQSFEYQIKPSNDFIVMSVGYDAVAKSYYRSIIQVDEKGDEVGDAYPEYISDLGINQNTLYALDQLFGGA